jgi:hypothetical protein
MIGPITNAPAEPAFGLGEIGARAARTAAASHRQRRGTWRGWPAPWPVTIARLDPDPSPSP